MNHYATKENFEALKSTLVGGQGDALSTEEKRDTNPTEKQIKYAEYLARRMCIELPKENTKQAYSEFISKWKPAVQQEDLGMNEPDEWQMQYM